MLINFYKYLKMIVVEKSKI